MLRFFIYDKNIFVVALACIFLIIFVAGPVAANPGLTVNGAILVTEVLPGETLIHKMTIKIAAADPATRISVSIGGLKQSINGDSQFVEPEEDDSIFSARQFITVNKDVFNLEPGNSYDLLAYVEIPREVGSGGKYAVINIKTQPIGQGNVGINTAVNVPVYLIVKGGQIARTGNITDFIAVDLTSGKPINMLTAFQNTGNVHYKVKGEVTISDAYGKVLDTIYIPVTSSILPGMPRQLKTTFIPESTLAAGVYKASVKLMLEDGTVLDNVDTSFELKESYTPPPPEASATLVPDITSSSPSTDNLISTPSGTATKTFLPNTLSTGDGRISITFAEGSVLAQTQVAIRSYPVTQLPVPPEGYQIADTCFRVDGLTRLLLAKDATLKVQYTAADLEKAEGNAAKLIIGRWDETNSEWNILKTTLDKNTMTLTASTDRFSLFAVMVNEHASSGLNPLVIICFVAGVVVICLIAFYALKKKRSISR